MTRDAVGIRFRERAIGTLACRADHGAFQGHDDLQWEPLSIDLMARIRDIDEFVASPAHRVGFEHGTLRSGHFGRCEVTDASIDLLVRVREPDERELRYRVCFTDRSGRPLTIFGYKDIRGRRFRVWYDTTRIFIELYEGTLHDHQRDDRSASQLVGAGVLEIPVHMFALQLPTIRAVAPHWRRWLSGYVRFMWFFSKNLTLPYWEGLLRRGRRDRAQWIAREPEQILDLARRSSDGPHGATQNEMRARGGHVSSSTPVDASDGVRK